MQPESTEPQVQPLPAIPASERERIYADVRAGEIPSVSPAMEAVNDQTRLRVYMPVDAKNLDDEQAVLDAQAEKLAIKRREHEALVGQWEALLQTRNNIRNDILSLGQHRKDAFESIEVKSKLVEDLLLSGSGSDFQTAAEQCHLMTTLEDLVQFIGALLKRKEAELPTAIAEIEAFARLHKIEA